MVKSRFGKKKFSGGLNFSKYSSSILKKKFNKWREKGGLGLRAKDEMVFEQATNRSPETPPFSRSGGGPSLHANLLSAPNYYSEEVTLAADSLSSSSFSSIRSSALQYQLSTQDTQHANESFNAHDIIEASVERGRAGDLLSQTREYREGLERQIANLQAQVTVRCVVMTCRRGKRKVRREATNMKT